MIFRLFGNMRESSMMLQKQSDTMLTNNYNQQLQLQQQLQRQF